MAVSVLLNLVGGVTDDGEVLPLPSSIVAWLIAVLLQLRISATTLHKDYKDSWTKSDKSDKEASASIRSVCGLVYSSIHA